MGSGTWSKDAYADVSAKRSTMSFNDNFEQNKKRDIHKDMTPKGIDLRESRDSDEHPNSIAIMVGLDVTGSMGDIPHYMITKKLGALMETIIANGVADPQIMFVGIGDHISDKFPLQVAQFESSTKALDDELSKIYIEQGGGGGGRESYPLIWHFAANHTSIDCFEKRGEKGFIFTIGDEGFHPRMEASELKDKIGYTGKEDLEASALYALASSTYNIFHIHVAEGSNGKNPISRDQWKEILNQNFLLLEDKNLVAELIATTIAVVHGVHLDAATSSFDEKTRGVVTNALATVHSSIVKQSGASSGVIAL